VIFRKDEYVQRDEGDREFPIKQVDRLEALEGEEVRFIGRAVLNMQSPIGIQQIPVYFEIPAATVQEAFEEYAECARPKIEETREHVQQQIERLRQAEEGVIQTPGEAGPGERRILNLDDFNQRS
jgi:hypothetical protein